MLVLLICLLCSSCATEGGQTVKPSKQTEKQPVQSEYREEVGETQGIPDHLTSDDNSKDNYIGTYQGVLIKLRRKTLPFKARDIRRYWPKMQLFS